MFYIRQYYSKSTSHTSKICLKKKQIIFLKYNYQILILQEHSFYKIIDFLKKGRNIHKICLIPEQKSKHA